MSRPMWVVYEVRSNSCSSAPNTISTCSTELRSPTSRLSTRLRTRRPPSWARAHGSVAPSPISRRRCWKATTLAGSSWRLATRSDALGPESDLGRAGEERLGRRRDPHADPARTPRRSTPRRRRRAGRGSASRAPGPAAPTAQRTTIGFDERDAGRYVDDDALDHSARVSWANLSSAGERLPWRCRLSRTASRSSRTRRSRDDAASAASESATAINAALVDLDQAVGVGGRRASRRRSRAGVGHEPGVVELRGAQVDVGRVQQVRLAGQRRPGLEGRRAGRPPASRARRRRSRSSSARVDRQRQLVEGPPRGPRS